MIITASNNIIASLKSQVPLVLVVSAVAGSSFPSTVVPFYLVFFVARSPEE
jgi:hypothetical protein